MGIVFFVAVRKNRTRSVNALAFQHPTVSSVTVCRPRKNDDETLGLRGRHRGKRLMLTRCVFLGSTPGTQDSSHHPDSNTFLGSGILNQTFICHMGTVRGRSNIIYSVFFHMTGDGR